MTSELFNQILIVDDSPFITKFISDVLKPTFKCHTAHSGKAALELIQGGLKPDLILLDVVMTDCDGYETCTRMKRMQNIDDVPIIFLTGSDQPEDEVKGFSCGASDFVSKPINPPVLKARIETHLKLRRTLTELHMNNARLQEAQLKSDKLLLNILPPSVCEALKQNGSSPPESFDGVSVLFSDLEGFTKISSQLDPKLLIGELNEISQPMTTLSIVTGASG